jgi:uncharacterized protein (TIGR02996 family)
VGKVRDAEAGFIEAIRQQSDDRSRWLIFADWLEERGDAHGELIRLQVHLSELPADDPGRGPLEARESELFRNPFSDCPSDSNLSCSSITLPLSAWCDAQLEPFRIAASLSSSAASFPQLLQSVKSPLVSGALSAGRTAK